MESIKLVGGDSEQFNQYLAEDDPCFGKHYSRNSDECNECNALVIYHGTLCPLQDLCRARCAGADDIQGLHRLTSSDVLARLQEGASVQELFEEILDGSDPQEMGVEARNILAARLRYLNKNKGIPVPDVPNTDELREDT